MCFAACQCNELAVPLAVQSSVSVRQSLPMTIYSNGQLTKCCLRFLYMKRVVAVVAVVAVVDVVPYLQCNDTHDSKHYSRLS